MEKNNTFNLTYLKKAFNTLTEAMDIYNSDPSNSIDILPEDKKIILLILAKHLPRHTKAWIFGSRATGRAEKYSALALLTDTGSRLSLSLHAELNADFEESDLPYKIDIVDWHSVDESFKKSIEKDRLLFWETP